MRAMFCVSLLSGLYAYVEASGHNNLEQRAILNSKVMKRSSSGRKCLRFWYHMYGKYMGKLRVIFKDVSTGAEKMLVTISGNKGDKWRQEEVDIHALSDFQVKKSSELQYSTSEQFT